MPVLRDVFISHSHHDRKAVEELAARLKQKFDLYVDLDDPLLAETPSTQIAARLLEELQYSRVLLVVLSARSVRSRWIPWELGLAHGRVGRILLWPLTQAAMRALKFQEYLHLYDVADPTDPFSSLQAAVEASRRDLITDALKVAAQLAGARAADASHFLHPMELPGASSAATTEISRNYSDGASGYRRK